MPRTTINCPNCRRSIVAEIDQLFDTDDDPAAKQKFLSGAFNQVSCPYCGFQGQVAVPIVYHDPQKEFLLTFLPPDLTTPRDEQERIIGAMINKVMNRLPQEKRKAYLLNPQSALTMQGLVEKVLEAEGITKEMIEAQQEKLKLIQTLSEQTDEAEIERIVKEQDDKIDAEFFGLLLRLSDAAMSGGDSDAAHVLSDLNKNLLDISTFGQEMRAQTNEIEAALADLQKVGQDLDREKLLELVIKAPNETRLRALVSFARPIMDYTFLLMLGERIDRARGDGRTRLADLRTSIVDMIEEYDKQVEAMMLEKKQLLDEILSSPDINETMVAALPAVDEFFVAEVNQRLESARSQGDLALIEKLQKILEIIKDASKPPASVRLIESLLDAPDRETRQKLLDEHQEEVTPEFISMLSSVIVQAQSSEDQALIEKATQVNREVLRFSMERNIR